MRITKNPYFDKIRLRLLSLARMNMGNHCPLIILTAEHPGEGVTTLSVALSLAFARAGEGRVLHIDSNPKGIRAASMLKIRASKAPRDDDGVITAKDGLGLLVFDEIPPPGSAMHEQWVSHINDLRSKYRFIIVDSGSLDSDNVYQWFNHENNYSVLVIDSMTATESTLERLRQRLQSAGIKLTGFIMNKRSFPVPQFLYRFVR